MPSMATAGQPSTDKVTWAKNEPEITAPSMRGHAALPTDYEPLMYHLCEINTAGQVTRG